MASGGYSITIKAVDQTSATISKINSRILGSQKAINARLQAASAPWKRLGGEIQKSVRLLGGVRLAQGVERTAKGFEGLSRHSFKTFENFTRIVDPLRVITGATTIAGITLLERRFAQLGQTLTNTGLLTNMKPGFLSKWEGAVRLSGGSASDADQGLRSLQYALGDAVMGMDNNAASRMQLIFGNKWKQIAGNPEQTLLGISRSLQPLHGKERANAIRNIERDLGLNDSMMAFLLRGPKAVQSYLNQSVAHGSMTNAQAATGDRLMKSLTGAQLAIEGVATAITSKLAGPLQKIVDAFTKWTDANRSLISSKIAGFIDDLAQRVAAFSKPVEQMAAQINDLVKSTIGWKTALEAVVGILVAQKVANIALPFVKLASAIGDLSGSGPRSFGALGRALSAIGFAVAGGQLVKLGVQAATSSQDGGRLAGDITTGAMLLAPLGPEAMAVGAALGAGYWGLTDPAAIPRSANLPPAIANEVKKAAAKYGVPADFALAQFRAEGGGFDNVSPAGAFGPAQLMPGTAKMLGVATSVNDPNYDWRANVDAGVRYDAMLMRHYNKQTGLVAVGYNMGPGAADSWIKSGGKLSDLNSQTRHYVQQIQANGGLSSNPQLSQPGVIGGFTPSGGDAHPGMYRSALDGQWHPLTQSDFAPNGGATGMGAENRSVLEIHTYDHRTAVKVRQQAHGTHIRTMSPMPAGAP